MKVVLSFFQLYFTTRSASLRELPSFLLSKAFISKLFIKSIHFVDKLIICVSKLVLLKFLGSSEDKLTL